MTSERASLCPIDSAHESHTVDRVNAFIEEPAFRLRVRDVGNSDLFEASDAVAAETEILKKLGALPEGGLLVVDFAKVRIASEAARQLLRRAIMRITSGEYRDRYVVLENLDRSRYSVDAMLRLEELTAVLRGPSGPSLLGKRDRVAAETFDFVATGEAVTAKMVMDHFGLQNIAAATNRLASLAKLALVRRLGPRALPTGGREYVFSAVR